MKRFFTIPVFVFALLFICVVSPGMAAIPEPKEQLVYSLNLFNGRGYTASFIPGSEEAIYLIADEPNAISPRITQVYFWDITGRQVAAFKSLNEELDGTVEVMNGGKVIHALKREEHVLFYTEGFMGEVSKLYRGEEARVLYQKHEKVMNDFYAKMNAYFAASEQYKRELSEYAKEVAKRKGAGEKMTAAQIEAEMPKKPKMPEPPRSAVGPVRKEYLINLPRGAYEIRLRAKNGTLVEESEKKVVAFTRRRQGGISYEVIPENMWTVKENCDDPSKVIYTIGGNTLFLRPFYADEYNELYYKKLLDPQNEGAAERWMWAHKGSIANIPIALLSKGKLLEKIKQAPYFVKQTPGSQLGYEIFPYKTDAFPGSSPTFEGYKVSFSPDKGNYEFRMEKDEKEIMEGSQRRITLIRKDRANFLYLVSFFPLLVGLAVFVRRRRSTS